MSDEASRMFAELVNIKRGDRDLIEVADEVYSTMQSGFKQYAYKGSVWCRKSTRRT